MTSSRLFRAGVSAALLSCGLASAASAQAGGARPGTAGGTATGTPQYALAPSGRAVTTVEFAARVPAGTPADQRPAPKRISIDYGQPHARGRDVLPLIPTSAPWRAGANTSTTFTTDVDMVINGLSVPKGSYSLYVQRDAAGAKLIVNKQTTQWGTVYDAKQDLGRVDMRVRTLSQPLDALQIVLAPAATGNKGVLRIVWGTLEMETDWEAKP
ncbi:MAG: DUF2911 domain-containing protein [Gemmatimonadota bacterium]